MNFSSMPGTLIVGLLFAFSPSAITFVDGLEILGWVFDSNLQELLDAMRYKSSPKDYYAKVLYDAMSGPGTDEVTLIDVLCFLSNEDMIATKDAYSAELLGDLVEDIVDDTGAGSFRDLLVALCEAGRDEASDVDDDLAWDDFHILDEAVKNHRSQDFIQIFTKRSEIHLKRVFSIYRMQTGHTIVTGIENTFKEDFKEGLIAIAKRVENRSVYFADRLFDTMDSVGTKNHHLIRLVITQFYFDHNYLEDYKIEIRNSFFVKHFHTLRLYIEDDTSGQFRDELCNIVD